MSDDKPWHSPKSPSQCQQDLCVLEIIRKPGVFLDIGSSKPIKDNNTYLLEQNGWTGTCIDKDYYNLIMTQCLKRAEAYDIDIMVQQHIDLYKSL